MQNNQFLKIGQPWPEQGGIFAGLMRGEDDNPDYYLILSTEKTNTTWGKYGEEIEGADSKFDGLANTTALIERECPAAKWAVSIISADGHNDFYLPAPRELSLLYANVPEHIDEEWHWSSQQSSARLAWIQHFKVGTQVIDDKNDELAVRAVRRVYPPLSCPKCSQGFMLLDEFSPSKSLVLTYKGHSKVVATQVFRECSICSYSFPEPLKDIDLDQELVVFKREVNIKISSEDL